MNYLDLIENRDQLNKNLETVESYLNENEDSDNFRYICSIIKHGHNFVGYRVGKEWHFVPSKFVGYVNNNRVIHATHHNQRHGGRTDAAINALLGEKRPEVGEKKFLKFCASLDISPDDRVRCFWMDDSDLEPSLTTTDPFTEGALVLRRHLSHERNRKAVLLAKQIFRSTHNGELFCEKCGFSFESQYGEHVDSCIQAHHINEVSKSNGVHKIRPEDFKMLCPNCHAMYHQYLRKGLDPETIVIKEKSPN